MMSTLVCSACSGVRVVTDRSVVLPFVCDACQNFQTEVAEPLSRFDYGTGMDDVDQVPQVSLHDDTATTEATVEMIADLEEQLQVAKELSQGQTELIEQLEQRLVIVTEERDDAVSKYETLDKKWTDLLALSREVADSSIEIMDENVELNAEIEVLNEKIEKLEGRGEVNFVILSGPFGYQISTKV